jgi:hypothetical protein
MPWKECSVMDERLRFVAQLLDGEGEPRGSRPYECLTLSFAVSTRWRQPPDLGATLRRRGVSAGADRGSTGREMCRRQFDRARLRRTFARRRL